MKKTALALLGIIVLLSPIPAMAQFGYTINGNGVTITNYSGAGGPVSIPSTINGLPVISIGVGAFFMNTNITSVTIPNSVTSIGNGAFADCAALVSLTVPNSVTNIGFEAFIACSSLSAITVDPGNSFYTSLSGVLFDKAQTTLIQYPGGKPGTYTIPNNVTNLADLSFQFCSKMSGVTIPNGVTSIGAQAFLYCTSLASLEMPSSVTSIGEYAFNECFSLVAITVDPANGFYSSTKGVLFDKGQTELIQYPIGNPAPFYTVPVTVTNIEDYAFDHSSALASITIPRSVRGIEQAGFSDCTALTNLFFLGNAPGIDLSDGQSSDFVGDTNATAYYLPGTSGWDPRVWGAKYGGPPALLWNPRMTPPALQNGQFNFDLVGTTNIPIVLEASTNLTSGPWVPLHTGLLAGGLLHFTDPVSTNSPARFYRVRWP